MGGSKEKQIFEVKGSELSSRDARDFLKKLHGIDTTVPQRTQGRRSHHRERYCIVGYLSALATSSRLTFPLRVVKWESPDFFLYFPYPKVGLEITEAGTERSQQADTQLEKSPLGTVIEGEASLRLPGEALRGRGYVGDEPVRKLSRLIIQRVEEKTATLNGIHFGAAGRYDLLVYDNSATLRLLAKLDDLAPIVKSSLMAWQAQSQAKQKFSTISVLRDSHLLYDCTGEASVLQVNIAP
ncbi:MAG: hypothetical protein HY739_02760 [Desulfobacterales bacterium]|nr:hypothetical protein [Desulfobacterales bacterium]